MDPITTVLLLAGIGIALVIVAILVVWKLMEYATERAKQMYIDALARPIHRPYATIDEEYRALVQKAHE